MPKLPKIARIETYHEGAETRRKPREGSFFTLSESLAMFLDSSDYSVPLCFRIGVTLL
jgi:hypothetical protein